MYKAVWLPLAFAFVVSLAAESVPAGSITTVCSVPASVSSTRPDPDGVPTQVSVGLYVIDINSISDRALSFSADFYLVLRWTDPRLSRESGTSLAGCKLRIDDVWNPRVLIVNQRQVSKQLEDVVDIDPQGIVTYRQRFYGDLSARLDLAEFPFDKQVLWIRLASLDSPDQVQFSNDATITGRMDAFSIPDWFIGPESTQVTSQYFLPQERNLSRFDLSFEARRDSGFYFWKVIVPLSLIVFMSWTVFWIDPSQLAAQLGVSTASVLTLIAFQFALSSTLPRISYLTRMDQFLLASTGLIFLALAESVLTSTLAHSAESSLPQKIDRWSRWVFPVLFAGASALTLI